MTLDTSAPRQGAAVKNHRFFLLFFSGVLLGSLLCRVDGPERVAVRGLELPLPGMCMTQRVLHFRCPGCGLTRSFVALAGGDFRRAVAFHALGPLMFFALLTQIPYRLYRMRRPCDPAPPLLRLAERFWGWTLIAGLIGVWVFEVLAAK